MSAVKQGYAKVIVPTDFSADANAATKLAVWVAEQSHGSVVLAHVLSDLRGAVHHSSYKARLDLIYGEGDLFERDIRKKADARLKETIAALGEAGKIKYETLLGEPFVEIIHAVQQENYDLVMIGSRGDSAWERFVIGSTAARLIRKCPCSVWAVKAEHATPPKVILAATDLSAASRRAVEEALWVAEKAGAQLHVLHVIDAGDIPPELLEQTPEGKPAKPLRQQVKSEAKERFLDFMSALSSSGVQIETQMTWGTPWREIKRIAKKLKADLIAVATVGRSGVPGVLLGNTAEKVLASCDVSILSVKPEGFVTPIQPATWPLHPGPPAPTQTKS
jgi:nucleotide-binding universal stress UspA family protein